MNITPIEEKITKTQKHLQRKMLEALTRKVDKMVFSPMERGRVRLKETLREVIKKVLYLNYIFENLTLDRNQWHHLVHVIDFI